MRRAPAAHRRHGIAELNLGVTEEQVGALVRALDTDGDGEISYDEFLRMTRIGGRVSDTLVPDDVVP